MGFACKLLGFGTLSGALQSPAASFQQSFSAGWAPSCTLLLKNHLLTSSLWHEILLFDPIGLGLSIKLKCCGTHEAKKFQPFYHLPLVNEKRLRHAEAGLRTHHHLVVGGAIANIMCCALLSLSSE